jgi:predicted GNAT superfamily acetyltransferase
MEQNFKIVRVTERESFKQLEAFQTIFLGRGDIIPYHVLIAFQEMGGLVLVAYDQNNRPVGLLCGYNSFKNGELFHYIHFCGVLPEYSDSELSTELRIAVRKHLLDENINQAVWLIDPLNPFEAYTSIHKLGGIGREYMRNFYGLMRGPQNRGLESDRLLIRWKLDSKEVEEKLSRKLKDEVDNVYLVNFEKSNVIVRDGPFKRILDYKLNLNVERFCLEIPTDIESMKKKDLSIAIEWREMTRRIFEHYLPRGYVIAEVLKDSRSDSCYYIFEKKNIPRS